MSNTPWKDDSQLVAEFENELSVQTNVQFYKLQDLIHAQKLVEDYDLQLAPLVAAFCEYAGQKNEQEARKQFIAKAAALVLPAIQKEARENTVKLIGYDVY